ncbi:Inositol 2-dehydrogenase [Thalassoglobus neptunius]|uniref:Inositol 2-dehydrogenase n=1 Tax=Thalassoglobus neptunius TaxID=1938619 RepID=A0A5C5X6D5_9PLAN|nr:Gfo/Idh/MocA family oxidoreductase [Thalassoglobus neptunius]TWT58209.1 Inositol 2-dehydrogenase [Thalassoglobus neptunius]
MSSSRLNRRTALQTMAASSLALLPTTRNAFSAPANGRLNLAFIGVGGRGGRNLKTMTEQSLVDVQVVALCDVNRQNLGIASKLFPEARTYEDFRELYFDRTDDIDAVVVSTTEHTHAYATMPALKMGKHVYCEKPLTLNVDEARRITQAAKSAGVKTQMGTQIHGLPNYRRVVELIQSGAIGAVREAHVWVSRAWGLQSKEDSDKNKDRVFVTERPSEAMTPPSYLNWDLWIGPAPMRPYHEVYFPGPKWYRWWDFGNGTMSDLGSHRVDLPWWALNLDAPQSIEAFGPEPHPEIAPASMHVTYEYDARGEMPPCTLTWYQGDHKPDIWNQRGIPQWANGALFIGEDGKMLLSDYTKHILLPEAEFANFKPPEQFIPDSPGQHEEWLVACRDGSETSSPFSYSGPLTEANHLGNVAFRAGEKLLWDSEALRVTNTESANSFLGREPRSGWSLD